MINGLQLAAYLPIINIKIPEAAGKFCGEVANIVTFDIPNVEMEQIPLLGKYLECPEEDSIFKDLEQESYSDQTIVGGFHWK